MTVGLVILIAAFFLFIGYIWGASKRGFMVYKTNELPDCLFTVVSCNKEGTWLREIGPKRRNFLITTEAFGGKPIRPKDQVKMFDGSKKEREALELPNLGYPPLVRVEEEIEEIAA